MNSNLYPMERILRSVFAATLLAGIIQFSFMPPWLALIAAYMVLTAIIAWEPFYALYLRARTRTPRYQPTRTAPLGV